MNVWIIDHYSSEPQYGGISRQYDFLKEFAKRGINVVVISASYSHFKHQYLFDEELTIRNVVENGAYAYVRVSPPYQRNNGLKRYLNSFSFVSAVDKNSLKLVEKFGVPDVVVGCSIHPFTWIASEKIARKYNAQFIVEVRDLWPYIFIKGKRSYLNPMVIYLGMLEKWAYKKADKIIYSMSKGDEYICDRLGFPKSKTIWIDQPMDCERFDRNAQRFDELPDELKRFIDDSFLCVFTGYYKEYEGVFEMLEAAKRLKDKGTPVKFLFVGSGDAEEEMRKYATKERLDNVLIWGRISKELVPSLLRRAQICLAHLASRTNPNKFRFDASKNKINEYMYSNSCIIYGAPIKGHFVESSGAGFVIDAYDANAFAEKIEQVFKMSEEERAKFGKNARTYVLEHNVVEKLVDKYLTILRTK